MSGLPTLVALVLALGCAASTPVAGKIGPTREAKRARGSAARSVKVDHRAAPWFQGGVAAAFAVAREQRKPLFLYWGAVWCPPCNAIKQTVFASSRFARVAAPFICVYLDGDSARAQIWGAKLKAMGYPTLLFFAPDGRELLRLSSGLTLGEFERAARNVAQGAAPMSALLARARAGRASDADWALLAAQSSYGLTTRGVAELAVVETLDAIASRVPARLAKVRAAAAANALVGAAEAAARLRARQRKRGPRTSDAPLQRAVSQVAQRGYLARAFADVFAARELFLYYGGETLRWLFPPRARSGPSNAGAAAIGRRYAAAHRRWLAALDRLGADRSLPLASRLAAASARVDLFRQHRPRLGIPQPLRQRVRAAVKRTLAAVRTKYQRKSVVSAAATLLTRVGALDAARALLDRTLRHTATPWYYQAARARLEEKAGRPAVALGWARKARLSARGSATRLQWTLNELAMVNRLAPPAARRSRALALAAVFYASLLELPDGFSGRNARSVAGVARQLRRYRGAPRLLAWRARVASRCAELDGAARRRCVDHVAQLAPPKGGAKSQPRGKP